jgi:hypothetical protein
MAILMEFKDKVFKVLEGYLSLAEFEKWLYKSDDLLNLMSRDVVLEAFTFNYKQHDAKYRFKKQSSLIFDEDEFMLWKVKSNLRDLIAKSNNRDRILYDFYCLGYDGYNFLQSIGYYMYQIEDIEYYVMILRATLHELKRDAENPLSKIEKQGSEKPGFRLVDYQSSGKEVNEVVL